MTTTADRLALRVSLALALVAAATSAASFVFWELFYRDVPAGVGNLRGTALTMLLIALPLLLGSMVFGARGSMRARVIWLGTLAYFAYNAVLLCFQAHFNSLFLAYAALLSLSFWSLVTLLPTIDLAVVRVAASRVPARAVALWLLLSTGAFAALWLVSIVPATIQNTMPPAILESGLTQNAVWVLDFAFTFPLVGIGAFWLWRRREWGFVVGGMMLIMLTIETASITIDQLFGHLHDPSAPLAAVPMMLVVTAAGALFSALFLTPMSVATAPAPREPFSPVFQK